MVAEMAQAPVESATEVSKSLAQENGKLDKGSGNDESIIFGSHGGGEPVKGEENNVSLANLPEDASEEWPAPKEIHSFYFIRHRHYDDPNIKAKIEQTDKEIQRRNQARGQLIEELRAKRADRGELAAQLRSLKTDWRNCKSIMVEKKKEMEPLQQALGKLRNNVRSGGICSSEEELNNLIHSLQYRIQHESIPLSEEKQLLREIKQLEGTRENVMANAAMRAKIQESMGQKEVIQDQVKLMGVDLDGVRKENQAVWAKISHLEGKVKAMDEELKALQEEVINVTEKRDKAFANLQQLRKQRDEGNANFFQYRTLSNQAKALSFKKDVQALMELSNAEVEKFMTLWNNNKVFRDDYEKRLLPSLDMRQLSRDGRIRNPDEKPLVVVETSVPSQTEIVAKPNVKQSKGDSKSASQKDTQKVQKEAANKVTEKRTVEHNDTAAMEIPVGEKPAPEKKVDEAKLKEMKKVEDRAKAMEGMERKRKKEEAKAALRAQKEAEKQLKERERKAKKKAIASGTATTEESAEAVTEAEESENADVNVEAAVEAPTPAKPKVRKENTVKYRSRPRGPESLPKAILKRKKSTNYWVWAAPAAMVVLLILVLVFYYLQ